MRLGLQRLKNFFLKIGYVLTENVYMKMQDVRTNQHDLLAMQYLAPLSTFYLPWNQSTMRPSGMVRVLNEIILNRRKNIVECGGGISTLYIARLIRQTNSHLYTIEHNREWADLLTTMLENEGLKNYVTIIFAPLKSTELALNACDWYDTLCIERALVGVRIDLLLVDGPPAYKDNLQYARYPAIPFFLQFLNDDYTIILDDIDRKNEQEIVEKWGNILDISFDRYFLNGNIAIGRSVPSFTV
ncbi:class I SAM-dependent methyltransferase [candidate division KSB1 bacterium]|nr:class I SAM-dependent methyltransferase [candidate division KSB1 bacterium]